MWPSFSDLSENIERLQKIGCKTKTEESNIHDSNQWFKSLKVFILEGFTFACALETFTLMHPEVKPSPFALVQQKEHTTSLWTLNKIVSFSSLCCANSVLSGSSDDPHPEVFSYANEHILFVLCKHRVIK